MGVEFTKSSQKSLTRQNILLGDFLVDQGLITKDQLEQALKFHHENGVKLGRAMLDLGFISEHEIIKALGSQLGVQYVKLKTYRLDREVVDLVPAELAWHYLALPLFRVGNRLTVAMVNPLDLFAIDALTRKTKLKIEPVVALEEDLYQALQKQYARPRQQPDRAESSASDPVVVVEEGNEQENLLQAIDILLDDLVVRDARQAFIVGNSLRVVLSAGTEDWPLPDGLDPKAFVRMVSNLGEDMMPGDRAPKRYLIENRQSDNTVRLHLFTGSYGHAENLVIYVQKPRKQTKKTAATLPTLKAISAPKQHPGGLVIASASGQLLFDDMYYALWRRFAKDYSAAFSLESQPTEIVSETNQIVASHAAEQLSALRMIELSRVDCLFLKDVRDERVLEQAIRIAEAGALVVAALQLNLPWQASHYLLRKPFAGTASRQLRQVYSAYSARPANKRAKPVVLEQLWQREQTEDVIKAPSSKAEAVSGQLLDQLQAQIADLDKNARPAFAELAQQLDLPA